MSHQGMDPGINTPKQSSITWFATASLMIILCILLAYYPGLSGDFEFDDSANILNNHALVISDLTPGKLYQASTTGGISGPLKRPVSMATLVINRYITGVDPFYMKLTNVIIHVINGLCIFLLSFLLIKSWFEIKSESLSTRQYQWLALAITMVWVLHPLTLTTNLYIIQRMTSLSALFSICGLITYVIARRRMTNGRNGILLSIAGLVIFGLLSVLSKENGAILPLFMLVIEITLFQFRTNTKTQKQFLYGFFILTVAVPAVLVSAWLIISPDSLLGAYDNRSFDLGERVFTEARVLWFYLYLILLPDISLMGLYHDDIIISHSLFTPWTTLPSIAGLMLLVIVAILKRKTLPVLSFGILFFFAGHSLESTIFPLEIAHEHRNYLPMYGVVFCVVFYIAHPLLHLSSYKLRISVTILFAAMLAVSTTVRASYWGSLLEHSLIETTNHPGSARAQYQSGRVYWKLAIANPGSKEPFFLKAREHFEITAGIAANKTDALFALLKLSFAAEFDMKHRWLVELLYELKHSPVPPSTPGMLHTFNLCQASNLCKLTHEQMLSIFEAILSNPSLKGNGRAAVLSSHGMYTARIEGLQASLSYFYQAAEAADGRLAYRLTLIDVLTKLSQFTEAQHQLEVAKSEDRLVNHVQQIAEKENALFQRQEMVTNPANGTHNSGSLATLEH